MSQPIYKKFGVAAPDFDALVTGQKEVGKNLKDALGGVRDLFENQKKQIVEQNTLSMEQRLKAQMKDAGLGGLRENPIDMTSIQQKFGDRVNIEKLNKTIASETERLKGEAITSATDAGLTALKESDGDRVAATQRFREAALAAGVDNKTLGLAQQAFVDSNAVAFDNAKAMKMRRQNETDAKMFEELQQPNANVEAIKAFYTDIAPKHERIAEGKRITDLIEGRQELSEEDAYTLGYYSTRFADQTKIELQPYRDNIAMLTQKFKNEPVLPQAAYDGSRKIMGELGGSVAGAIGDWGTNFLERWHWYDDAAAVQGLYEDLISTEKLNSEDAQAVLYQAFADTEKDIGAAGNDIDDVNDYLKTRANQLAGQVRNKYALSAELTKAQQELAAKELEAEGRVKDFTHKLRSNLQRENLGAQDAVSAEQFASDYLTTALKKRTDAVPPPGTDVPPPGGKVPPPTTDGLDPSSPYYYLYMENGIKPPNNQDQFLSGHAPAKINTPKNAGPQDLPSPTAFGNGSLTDSDTLQRIAQERKNKKEAMSKVESGPSAPDDSAHDRQVLENARKGVKAEVMDNNTVKVAGEIRKGGTKSWRNRNRGNVKYSNYMKELGAVGKDPDGFAIFPSEEIGDKAMERLLRKGRDYKNTPMSKAIAKYAPKSENDTARYVDIVLKAVGGKDKPFREYTLQEQAAILQAMRKHEGYEEGDLING